MPRWRHARQLIFMRLFTQDNGGISMATIQKEKRKKRLRFPRELRLSAVLGVVVLVLLGIYALLPKPAAEPPDAPDWVTPALLPINPYSRPGDKLEGVKGVVIHYTGNPGTTAEQNRSYFASLADTHETHASSNFIIGLEGKILECVPLDEVAYASSQRNIDTLSIEVCHPDEGGEFSETTYASLTKLVQWLTDTYHLSRDQILRHYDVTGKECPRYYVRNPDAWERFLDGLDFTGKAGTQK